MGMKTMVKIGKTLGTVAGTASPQVLLLKIAGSVVFSLVVKQIVKKIEASARCT